MTCSPCPGRCGFEMVETNLMASVYGKSHGFGRCLGRCLDSCARDDIVLFAAKRKRNVWQCRPGSKCPVEYQTFRLIQTYVTPGCDSHGGDWLVFKGFQLMA